MDQLLEFFNRLRDVEALVKWAGYVGLTSIIFFYAAINLMMVMGLAPVVGIPLPLLSYGGSAMMTVMICLGLLMGIDRQNRRDRDRRRSL